MQSLPSILASVESLLSSVSAAAVRDQASILRVGSGWSSSAANLVQYAQLRSALPAGLQADLVRCGLSSLSRREAHIEPTLRAVHAALIAMNGGGWKDDSPAMAMDAGVAALERHADELLGPPHPKGTRIMVSLPPTMAADPSLADRLIDAGMDVARINAAHGSPEQWRTNAAALRAAAARASRTIRLCVDLAGPKVRTGTCSDGPIEIRPGDRLWLHADDTVSTGSARAADGSLAVPHRIAITPRDLLSALKPAHRVLIDDGNIRGRCTTATSSGAEVLIERVRSGAWPLKDRKGVNVPDSDVAIPSLTTADLATLDAVAGVADIVALSFVRSPQDILDLHQELDARGLTSMGVVAKVETPQACRDLPAILLALMRRPSCGVMLARGDLGVEIGFENLPIAQDEVLALCEAAHMPVIWATQVLESMTENGFPTRGEVTDAADSARADAVMLGIGPHLLETTAFVHDLLMRIQRIRARSRALLVPWGGWNRA
ncbi:MAG: pyruvate kinase [Phycisphaerae bacterium]|nr:pyruvate kinase [Phycisphaerae bacterium]